MCPKSTVENDKRKTDYKVKGQWIFGKFMTIFALYPPFCLLLPAATNPCSIQASDGVIRIPGVLHLHEGEARGPPRYPDVPDGSVLGEGVLQVVSNKDKNRDKTFQNLITGYLLTYSHRL